MSTMLLLTRFIESQGYDIEVVDHFGDIIDYKITKKKKTREKRPATRVNGAEYTDEFEAFWKEYPQRAGSNPKQGAFDVWRKNLIDGADPRAIRAGAQRYKRFCDQTGKTGTEYVMMATSFLSPKKLAYLELWAIPKRQIQLPGDDSLVNYASKNGMSAPRKGETMREYRHRLQVEMI